MRSIVLFVLLISTYKCDVVRYWYPFDPVVEHIVNETTKIQNFVDEQTVSAKNFIDGQTALMKQFFEQQKVKLDETINSSYSESQKIKDTFDNYIEEQQKYVRDEYNNYVEDVKRRSNAIVSSIAYVPTDHKRNYEDNPNMLLSVPSTIAKNGYLCETHTIISQGYILNVHRIPRSKSGDETPSKTIYFQHGIFASSADWILNGPEKALPYVLADAGYDVWMGNIRGNRYSREHIWLKSDSKEYWDFSWHDVALYDVPAIIDYIRDFKGLNTKITYIGHSMGTTILFAMLSLKPEYNKILSAGIALAPVVYMSDIKSPLRSLAPIASNVAYMEMLYGSHEFIPKSSFLGKMSSACDVSNRDFGLCKNVIFYICGADEKQINETLIPTFISNLGTGTSWKTAVHFAQEIVANDRFQQFDYGAYFNIEKYGTIKPPEYDLSKITLPLTLIWAKNDLLSSEKDVKKLYEKLPNYTEMYLVPYPKFNHLDYLWAIDAKELLNDKILNTLARVFDNNRRRVWFNFNFA